MIRTQPDLFVFLHDWHAPWLPAARPAAAPNLALPAPLAELQAEFAPLIVLRPSPDNGHRAPFATQDRLLRPADLVVADGQLTFATDHQGNWSARCAPTGDDPPVWSDAAQAWDDDAPGFTLACPSLSHFLTTLCLQEACLSAPHLLVCHGASPHEVLTVPAQPLWLDGQLVQGPGSHHFHRVPGPDPARTDLLVMHTQEMCWVAAHTTQALALIQPGVSRQVIRP